MKGGVIYYSNYGSTKQYAEWIAEAAGFALYDQRDGAVPWDELDTVVIGSPALKMQPFLAKWITENWASMQDKRVFLYTTSGAPGDNPALRRGFEAAFPKEIASRIEYFPFQGRLVWRELKPMHRLMMRIGQMIEKDPKRKAEMVEDVDGVDRTLIAPLVQRISAVG
jgi:flavodoxin